MDAVISSIRNRYRVVAPESVLDFETPLLILRYVCEGKGKVDRWRREGRHGGLYLCQRLATCEPCQEGLIGRFGDTIQAIRLGRGNQPSRDSKVLKKRRVFGNIVD